MMDFRQITIDDYKSIERYISSHKYKICDYTDLGLYMWVDYFGYEFAIENDTLYIKETINEEGNRTKYMLPLSDKISLLDRIDKLFKFNALYSDKTLILNSVPEECLDEIKSRFEITEKLVENWSDYFYDANALITLAGKKYAKKRNLVHQFESLYRYSIVPITKDILQDIIDFVEKERKESELSELAEYENGQTIKILENYSVFNITGYVIYIDNKIVAFSIGEYRNNTFFVHIEKAEREYKGVYQMINMLALREAKRKYDFDYVNREEDVGDEGLRHAKSSYFPIKMLKKYEVEVKKCKYSI